MKDLDRDVARIFEVFKDASRIKLLRFMLDKPDNYSNIPKFLDIVHVEQPTISHHLRIMVDRGIIENRRIGQNVYYYVCDPQFVRALLDMVEFHVKEGRS